VYRFDVVSAFLIAEKGGKTISVARGRVRPKVKSPFDSLILTWYRSALEFFGYLLPFKSYSDFFDIHVKCPFTFFGKGFPREKKFSSLRRRKGSSLVISRRLRHCACKWVQWSGL
jgi:hypothetical protein